MNKQIFQLLLFGLLAIAITACGNNETTTAETAVSVENNTASNTSDPMVATATSALLSTGIVTSTATAKSELTENVTEHDHDHDDTHTDESDENKAEIVQLVTACDAFLDNTTTHCDAGTAFVESDGLPTTHDMMVGIISWQQQVPLPQAYTGDNAWQIPLDPELSDDPISAATDMYRGAIALAVNGVPIFNALNNRGDDAYLAGELDQWGGHSGRADDYHYHIAPTHLQEVVGTDQPIAYALDGFPLYGLTEPDGSLVVGLDEYNGHFDDDGNYHYHATETYPYINGGMRGTVDYENGQIEPQPHTHEIRPAGEPLRGAEITAFEQTGTNAFSLQYTLNDETYTVNYAIENGTYTFEFIDAAGKRTVETYTP